MISFRSRLIGFLSVLFLLVLQCAHAAENKSLQIKVDQVGYLPGNVKVAIITAPAKTFEVRRTSDNVSVFKSEAGPPAADQDTGDSVQVADFSKLRDSGTYYLDVPGVGQSWTFSIGPNVFSHAYYLAMRAFYGQRCGIAVDLGPEFPGYAHAACHLKASYHASSGSRGPGPTGGWHDAGDYSRYVVNSGLTAATLLWAYELFGDRVGNVNLH